MKGSSISASVTEPYAEALMSIAQSGNFVDQAAENVEFILSILKESDEFNALISNPLIKGESKKAVIRQVTEGRVEAVFSNFLMLLVDRRRIFLLESVCRQFQAMVRELRNTVLAEVTSTIELNEAQQETVKQKVQSMTNANAIELEMKVDPDLLGGVIIKIGSQVLDASIRGQLRRINASLLSAS